MLEVVTALQGSLSPVDCLDGQPGCERCTLCDARGLWKKLKDAQEKVLAGVTLQDLAEDRNSYADSYII